MLEQNDSRSTANSGIDVTCPALFSDLQLFDDGMSKHTIPPQFSLPKTEKARRIVASTIFLMHHNLFFTSSHRMPSRLNPDASAAHLKQQSWNHGSVVCGARAWLLSGVTL